jgi:hypothetical protein
VSENRGHLSTNSFERAIIVYMGDLTHRSTFKDVTGQQFSKLTVLEYAGNYAWRCRCECGNVVEALSGNLRKGRTQSCGCHKRAGVVERNRRGLKDMTGQVFGQLTVVSLVSGGKSRSKWRCLCECGRTVDLLSQVLRSGRAHSCGCARATQIVDSQTHNTASNLTRRFHSTKDSALKRGYSFEVSRQQFDVLVMQLCAYCGASPSAVKIGLDRVDNRRDYVIDNVVPCCRPCNLAKHTMTRDEYVDHCRRVVQFSELNNQSFSNCG